MPIEMSCEIESRSDFALLCNWRRLYRAVEIGVDRAVFAIEFLSKWDGFEYWGVDPYFSCHEFMYDRDCDYQFAVQQLSMFANRARLVRQSGTDFLQVRKSLSPNDGDPLQYLFEFGYIDGMHDKTSALCDMNDLWPLISESGVMAGHDFDDRHPGVMEAVNEFCDRNGVTAYITHEKDVPASWYIYKSESFYRDWTRLRFD